MLFQIQNNCIGGEDIAHLLHRNPQTMSTDIRLNLRQWIHQELPSLKIPGEETLNALTSDEEGRKLWQNVIRRVRTEEHAKEIRAFLTVVSTDDKNLDVDEEEETEDEEEKTVTRLRHEARLVEEELEELRKQLEDQSHEQEGDIIEDEVEHSVTKVVSDILAERESDLSNLLELVQTSPWGDGDVSDSNSETEIDENNDRVETVIENWCQNGLANWDEAQISLENVLMPSWGDRVGSTLLTQLNENRSFLTNNSIEPTKLESGTEELVRDAQLRAFSRVRALEAEHQKAQDCARAMKRGVDKARLLWAEVQAQRAALNCATQTSQINSGTLAERRVRRSLRRGKDAVTELEDCAKRLCTGSYNMIEAASTMLRDVMSTGAQLESKLPHAVRAAEEIVAQIEKASHNHKQETDVENSEKVQHLSNQDGEIISMARSFEIERWSNDCQVVVRGLTSRSEILCEQRVDLISRADKEVVPLLREARNEAVEWRSMHIPNVRKEIQCWSNQPAKEIASWLFEK